MDKAKVTASAAEGLGGEILGGLIGATVIPFVRTVLYMLGLLREHTGSKLPEMLKDKASKIIAMRAHIIRICREENLFKVRADLRYNERKQDTLAAVMVQAFDLPEAEKDKKDKGKEKTKSDRKEMAEKLKAEGGEYREADLKGRNIAGYQTEKVSDEPSDEEAPTKWKDKKHREFLRIFNDGDQGDRDVMFDIISDDKVLTQIIRWFMRIGPKNPEEFFAILEQAGIRVEQSLATIENAIPSGLWEIFLLLVFGIKPKPTAPTAPQEEELENDENL